MKNLLKYIPLSLLFIAYTAHAQLDVLSKSALTIKLTPQYPTPGSQVTAELSSLNIDIDKANITWVVDGKTILKGSGEKKITFIAASRGSSNKISASATDLSGKTTSAFVTLRPQNIDFLVQTGSRVPYWYKGASLPSTGSRVTVTAMPDFVIGATAISPSSLYYDWRVDNKIRKDLSGKGKRTVSFISEGQGFPKQLELKASSLDGSIAHKSIFAVEANPQEILFYEKGDSSSPFSQAISKKTMSANDKIKIQAVPFYLNYSNPSDLQYEWANYGKPSNPVEGEPSTIEIEAAPGSEGMSVVFSILITNTKNLLQKISNTIYVQVK